MPRPLSRTTGAAVGRNVCQKPLNGGASEQLPVGSERDSLTHRGANQSGPADEMKTDCGPCYFSFFLSPSLSLQTGGADGSQNMFFHGFFRFFFFLLPSTHSAFTQAFLNWHGRGESQKAPGRVFDAELRSRWRLSACQKRCTSDYSSCPSFAEISQKLNPSTRNEAEPLSGLLKETFFSFFFLWVCDFLGFRVTGLN